eukprot:TRINITY_DN20_c0_g1_i2.p1 TRINITY_DN20_c0_g1~~TRINITY_DN20_c0_g1_i2.p1  ORF type:complete len:413 (+),score=125.83 TRINITY_DN20_c0_g1_i2:129-1367(+)
MTILSKALVVLGMSAAALADNYAVIVAGSNTYANYRHQADACHAYQILSKGGIPKENIIMMMYDDIAHNIENPFRGKIFNKPSSGPGVDVYEGCNADYTRKEVTPDNFLAVLTGDASKTGGKKVLNSTSNDNVFINFVDHGGVGIIAFPDGQLLHADKLQASLKTMHTKNMYKELVFYMEACESGSMFEDFPTDLNMYVTTAANAQESSWGTYCPPQDVVDGKSLNTCLGDLYSVNWMQNADKTDLTKESLQTQFERVKVLTNKSHVQQFGTKSMTSDMTSQFEGTGKTGNKTEAVKPESHADSRDISLVTLYNRYLNGGGSAAAAALIKEIEQREAADQRFAAIQKEVIGNDRREAARAHRECYRPAHEAVVAACGPYTDYSLKHSKTIAYLCDVTGGDFAAIQLGAQKVC